MWGAWREQVEKSISIDRNPGEGAVVEELAAFMVYCAHDLGNKESTIAGKLVAVKFYHQQFMGVQLTIGFKPVFKRSC